MQHKPFRILKARLEDINHPQAPRQRKKRNVWCRSTWSWWMVFSYASWCWLAFGTSAPSSKSSAIWSNLVVLDDRFCKPLPLKSDWPTGPYCFKQRVCLAKNDYFKAPKINQLAKLPCCGASTLPCANWVKYSSLTTLRSGIRVSSLFWVEPTLETHLLGKRIVNN